MRTVARATIVVLGGIIVMGFARPARAGCADPSTLLSTGKLPDRAAYTLGGPPPAAYAMAQSQSQSDGATIVGLWQFTFTSQGNGGFGIKDGDPLDRGYAQWHDDGTEIMNSSRDPGTSNFCLGVYEHQTGRSYSLTHWALSWDNTGKFCALNGKPACFVGAAKVRETVTVGTDGGTYTGLVTIDQYNPDGTAITFTLHGTVSAQRIRPE